MQENRTVVFIFLFLLLLSLLGGNFYFFLSRHKQPEISDNGKSGDHEFKKIALANILTKEVCLARDLSRDIKINYLSSHNLYSPRQSASFMYERLKKMAEGLGIDLINFSPGEKISCPNFSKIPFSVEIIGNFLQIVALFSLIEEEGLTIDSFQISNRNKIRKSAELHCRFKLSGIEIDDFYSELLEKDVIPDSSLLSGTSPGLLLIDRWKEKKKAKRLKIIKNPFSQSSSDLDFAKTRPGRPDEPIDISQSIPFSGVMSFPDHRVAIIEHKVVKVGELVRGKRVVSIKKNRVILKEGDQLYLLRLAEGVPR